MQHLLKRLREDADDVANEVDGEASVAITRLREGLDELERAVLLETEKAWAAGLFEGEGSAVPRARGRMLLSLAMTDRDVVEHFRQVIGAGMIAQREGRHKTWKRSWHIAVNRTPDVLRILDMMYPYLGIRRRARIDELRGPLEARIADVTKARRCVGCGRSFVPPFDPRSSRRRFCNRACLTKFQNATHTKHRIRRPGANQIGLDL